MMQSDSETEIQRAMRERIDEAHASGFSMAELAHSMGLDETTISKHKKGEREWKAKHLEGLANYLGISLAELLTPGTSERVRPELHRMLDEILLRAEQTDSETLARVIRQTFQLYRMKRTGSID